MEIKTFNKHYGVDNLLLSEIHLTDKHHQTIIPKYKIFSAEHLDENSYGIHDRLSQITISTVHCPFKHTNKVNHFVEFFNALDNKLIVGVGYNVRYIGFRD